MGINAEFKKMDVEIQMFIKNMETNLTNIITTLHNLNRCYEELNERVNAIEGKINH